MGNPASLLLVDDDTAVNLTLKAVLENEGYRVWTATSLEEAEALLNAQRFDAAIVDLRLGEHDGIEVLWALRGKQPDCVPIMLTGYASLESAVAAIRQGAYDYLMKPCDLKELKLTVKGAVERGAMARSLREHLEEQNTINEQLRARVAELRRKLDTTTSELEQKAHQLVEAKEELKEVQHRRRA